MSQQQGGGAHPPQSSAPLDYSSYRITVGRLLDFLRIYSPRGWTERVAEEHFRTLGQVYDEASIALPQTIAFVEELVASVIGVDATRAVLHAYLQDGYMHIRDVLAIVNGTRYFFHFSQNLLRSSLDNLEQGISVVDKDLRLIVWNTRYVQMFEYPPELVAEGRSIEELIRYNAVNGECGPGEVEELVERRLEHLRKQQPHYFERHRSDGRVIAMHGNPIPGGGYVTSFTDVTAHKNLVNALKEANEHLEERVAERTRELTAVNAALRSEIAARVRIEEDLRLAKQSADRANEGKTKFLAAASHDLMQPLNAAGLFASALGQQLHDENQRTLIDNIVSSLDAAEALLSSLLEASRLDAGAMKIEKTAFSVDQMLETLARECDQIAQSRNLDFRVVLSRINVCSQKQMLRRILQNFLSNALRYTRAGRVLLGARRRGDFVELQVWDTGPGIPADKLDEIFQEFHRLERSDEILSHERGLGLGLAISDRMAKLLGHDIRVRSWPGAGSMFSVLVPIAAVADATPEPDVQAWRQVGELSGRRVLCVDNDPAVLEAMAAILGGWHCTVLLAQDFDSALTQIAQVGMADVMLVDYQLDEDLGTDLMDRLKKTLKKAIPGIVVSASNTPEVRHDTQRRGYLFLPKPLKPAALRAVMSSVLEQFEE
jgi:PAS domain S-box-containing protein